MTPRDTGLRVSLPLWWRGDDLWIRNIAVGGWLEGRKNGDWGAFSRNPTSRLGIFPTRAAAEAAVEAAVMQALGERREG